MEHKRSTGRQSATESYAGNWLGVSEIRSAPALRSGASLHASEICSAPTLRLIADSLGGRSLSSHLELAHPSRVSTPEAPYTSRYAGRNGEIDHCRGVSPRSNLSLSPFSGISNRELSLLEHVLTHRKQTRAPRSNRELSTNQCCFDSPQTNRRQSVFSALPKSTGVRLLPSLPGSASQAESDVTYSKQRTEEFLPGATT